MVARKAATGVDCRRPGPGAGRRRRDPDYASRGGLQARRRAGRVPRDRGDRQDAAWTPARRPAGSPTCCCARAPDRSSPSTSGYGQLAWPLRSDERVDVHDRTNVRTLQPDDIGGPAELTVADLSFISLRLVLPALAACTVDDGDLLPMVKPQFEVGRERLGSGGVVRDPALRADAVARGRRRRSASSAGTRPGCAAARCPGRRERGILPVAAARAAVSMSDEQIRTIVESTDGGDQMTTPGRVGAARRAHRAARDLPGGHAHAAQQLLAAGHQRAHAARRGRHASSVPAWWRSPAGSAAAGAEIVARPRRRRHVPARGRARPAGRGADARRQPRPRRLPRRGRAERARRHRRRHRGRAATRSRSGSPSTRRDRRRRGAVARLGAERGVARTHQPRADARDRGGDRRRVRCCASAATASSARPRPARPPTRSRPAVRSCGPTSTRCCSSPTPRTPCSRGRSSSRPPRPSTSTWSAAGHEAVLSCDGRRSVYVPPGSRVRVATGAQPVRIARVGGWSFADRLVAKFQLPVRSLREASPPAATDSPADLGGGDARGTAHPRPGRHRRRHAPARARPDRRHRRDRRRQDDGRHRAAAAVRRPRRRRPRAHRRRPGQRRRPARTGRRLGRRWPGCATPAASSTTAPGWSCAAR